MERGWKGNRESKELVYWRDRNNLYNGVVESTDTMSVRGSVEQGQSWTKTLIRDVLVVGQKW